MKKLKKNEKPDPSEVYTELYLSSKKLTALASLIEHQSEEKFTTHHFRDVNWGIALILESVAQKIHKLGEVVEGVDFKKET